MKKRSIPKEVISFRDINLLKKLKERGFTICEEHLYQNTSLEVLQFLFENTAEPIDQPTFSNIICYHSSYGALDILKWIKNKYGSYILASTWDLTFTAALSLSRHYDIIYWMIDNGHEYSARLVIPAARDGKLDLLQHICLDIIQSSSAGSWTAAVENGRLIIMEWLAAHNISMPDNIVLCAKSPKVFNWLLRHGASILPLLHPSSTDSLYRVNSVDILQVVREHASRYQGVTFGWESWCQHAIKMHNLEMFSWTLQNAPSETWDPAWLNCYGLPDFDIVSWLWNNQYPLLPAYETRYQEHRAKSDKYFAF